MNPIGHIPSHGPDRESDPDAPTPMPAPGSIVVGVDGSSSSLDAVTWAAEQAARDHRTLALVHAYTLDPLLWIDTMGVDRDLLTTMEADGRKLLLAAADHAHRTHPDLEVHEWLFHADARPALLEAARDAAMLVVGSRGRGPVASLLLGSVGVALVRRPTCPVVVRRADHDPTGRPTGEGVLVGVDPKVDALPVLETAYQLAASRDLPLTVVTLHQGSRFLGGSGVGTPDRQDRARLAAWITELAVKYPEVRASERDVDAPAARALVEGGAGMDLVVVGTYLSAGVSAAIGQGLAVTVVEHAPTTVVVVPLA
jgi:nucleotide-binding universal stress UspA family protein